MTHSSLMQTREVNNISSALVKIGYAVQMRILFVRDEVMSNLERDLTSIHMQDIQDNVLHYPLFRVASV
jgi:hypothetical protein